MTYLLNSKPLAFLRIKSFMKYAASAALIICMVSALTSCGGSSETDTSSSTESANAHGMPVTVSSGESLEISAADITGQASFYPVETDGVQMEVLAVRDSEGRIRTAFNTCQVCFGSDKAYYEQSGSSLICQNCGNQFSMDQVGIESGGCNPWPILEDDITITDDTVSISYDYLAASGKKFSEWSTGY